MRKVYACPLATTEQLVVCSLIWVMASKLTLSGNLLAATEIKRICVIPLSRLSKKELDVVENAKIDIWENIGEKYGRDFVISMPQLIECVSWPNIDFLNSIDGQYERWLNSMVLTAGIQDEVVKQTNDFTDEFVQILKNYKYEKVQDV